MIILIIMIKKIMIKIMLVKVGVENYMNNYEQGGM